MKRSALFVTLIICLLSLTPVRAAESAGLRLWFVDSLIKIFPSDAVGSHRLIRPELLAVPGQHVSVQLAVRSVRPLEGLTAEVGTFKRLLRR